MKGTFMTYGDSPVRIEGVRIVGDDGTTIVVEVAGRRFRVPERTLRAGSTARRMGDEGTLVIPTSVARKAGLQ
jgi:hypothetical protein